MTRRRKRAPRAGIEARGRARSPDWRDRSNRRPGGSCSQRGDQNRQEKGRKIVTSNGMPASDRTMPFQSSQTLGCRSRPRRGREPPRWRSAGEGRCCRASAEFGDRPPDRAWSRIRAGGRCPVSTGVDYSRPCRGRGRVAQPLRSRGEAPRRLRRRRREPDFRASASPLGVHRAPRCRDPPVATVTLQGQEHRDLRHRLHSAQSGRGVAGAQDDDLRGTSTPASP